MKLRATSAVLLLVLPATLLLAILPPAGAAVGDTLVVGGASIVPGNPCSAWGPAGGVAVKEAGTASHLYYGTRNVTRIHIASAFLSTTTPPACVGSITPAVAGTDGWQALAYDAYHPSVRLWAARNASGTIHGLTLSGALVATITVPGVSQITGLAVDEAAPHHLFVATGSATVLRYQTTGAPTLHSSTGYAHGVSHLAAWGGALLTADGGDWVRNHRVDGTWLGMHVHPGDSFVDPWWQVSRSFRYFDDMAFDEQTYAASGKGALWTTTTETWTTCIANCPVYECQQYEGPTCIKWVCVANCSGGVYSSTSRPTLRAFELTRTCPGGGSVPPTQECVCGPNAPQPVFTSPQSAILVRGDPVAPAPSPVVVQGVATVTAQAPSAGHVVTIRGPLPGGAVVSGYGSASAAPLVASALPRGAYTYEASVFDAVQGCRGGTAQLTVHVESPVVRSMAQALRIEGNVPVDLVLATVRAEPADDLAGSESASVVDRSTEGDVFLDAALLEANATHGPDLPLDPLRIEAGARAALVDVHLRVDLATLCGSITGQPACALLPFVKLSETDLEASSSADMRLLTAQGSSSSSTTFHEGVDGLRLAPTDVSVGGFHARFDERWTRSGPLFVEAYAAALRIEVAEGPYRGEIVIAQTYAGVSLGGGALLAGPTSFVERPDDYATGADAPSAGGPTLAPGAYSGAFAGADRIDAFVVAASVGEKLRVVVDPAHRVAAHAAPLPTAPAPLVAPRLMRVTLHDPAGVARDVSSLGTLDAHPATVELNVDVTGFWRLVVERMDARDELAPYSVVVQRSAVHLLAGDDAPTCAGATPLPATGAVAASMGATDAADTFSIAVQPGQMVSALLQPGDAEGADLDLRLLDGACNVLAFSTLGKGPGPKGETDRILRAPAPAGTAYLQVVRVNGIGNYALEAIAHRSL